jgi:elongation factor Ts
MTQITASMVKELREKSGAGMMDAKKALTEVDGDMEAAIDFLRKKGMAKADKKSSRTAAEGLVAIVSKGNEGAVVEINSETDFVARNEQFQTFVRNTADKAMDVDNVEALLAADYEGKPVSDTITDLVATIGENMAVRRMEKLSVSEGAVVGYVHNAVAPNLGKIGVLVALESAGDQAALQALGKQLAMHVAAAFPQCLDADSADQEALERERSIIRETALAEGKPAEIVEKMLDGRMKKYLKEICLMDQIFVMDGETSIANLVKNAEKEVGAPVTLKAYSRIQLGEGIEKEEEDFAAEVAKTAAG